MSEHTFPQFRKLKNNKSYYKITSERTFIELQSIGVGFFKINIKASKYPEIILIQDMLNFSNNYKLSSEEEFNTIQVRIINE